MKALIFGCGYLGQRVADRWVSSGHQVTAVTRSTSKAETLRNAGLHVVIGDVTHPTSLDNLPAADIAVYAVAYAPTSPLDRQTVVVGGLRNTLGVLRGRCKRLIFISTTSVYGQSQGEWVDDRTPAKPRSAAGQFALAAENLVTETVDANGLDSVILRLSGLYGPGRLLRRVEQLHSRVPIEGDGEAWLNLIHVRDAATAVLLAADRLLHVDDRQRQVQRELGPERFLISDDLPVRRRDYYGRLAELVGAPPPLFDATREGRSRGLGKRCRNDQAKRVLGLALAWPTFEQGIISAIAHEA